MKMPDWFERPARWLDRAVDTHTKYVQDRIPVDDEKLAELRETKRAMQRKETRFAANFLWWVTVGMILFSICITAFLIIGW